MSHHATNWAIQQRGLKPALKVVLWHLADRHHRDNGCFPSQDTLADDCEVPRSTLNVYLDELEKRGLIARERRRIEGSQKMARTRYYFPFEPEFSRFSTPQPSPETGHGVHAKAESRNQPQPSPEIGESRVQNLDSNPVREPVKEPVREREAGERDFDGSGEDDRKQLTKRVKALELGRNGNPWPGALSSSTQWALTQFEKLSVEERQMAEERRDDYLAAVGKKAVALGVYLRDRKFLDIQPREPRPIGGGAPIVKGRIAVPVFGPAFAAARMLHLLSGPASFDLPADLRERVKATYEVHNRRGPHAGLAYRERLGLGMASDGSLIFPDDFESQEYRRRVVSEGFPDVNRMHDAAKERSHVTVDAVFECAKELCEFVPMGCDVWLDWEREHEVRGWPMLPAPNAMRGAYFPKGGPEGLEEFERSARSLMEARGEDDAA